MTDAAAATAVPQELERAGELLRSAERPVIMAGSDLYWGRGEGALLALAQTLRIPVFLNGLARGCVPADHELFVSTRAFAGAEGVRRGARDRRADGLPARLRRRVRRRHRDPVIIDAAEGERRPPRSVAVECYGALEPTLTSLREAAGDAALASSRWIEDLREAEQEKRDAERAELTDSRAPLHPMRVYAELAQVIDRDTIVIGDGGDDVPTRSRVVDSYNPGAADPGPFGCLGTGPG